MSHDVKNAAKASTRATLEPAVEPPLDYSFIRQPTVAEVVEEGPRTLTTPRKCTTESGKSASRCLKLNNNNLLNVDGIAKAVDELLDDPVEQLSWLDLSYNHLATIDEELLQFKNIEILYLHGNALNDIKQVDKLCVLKKLKKLTLHGNSIDSMKGYRCSVIGRLPELKDLDFSLVTKADRETAANWNKMNGSKQKAKKKAADA